MAVRGKQDEVFGFGPGRSDFLTDVIDGLQRNQKTLPCKYLYDQRGSRLFDEICNLREYYPTRTELGIMRDHVAEMTGIIGDRCVLVEYGSGSSLKTRILLDHLTDAHAYVPVDISREHLQEAAENLRRAYPKLTVLPVWADYTDAFDLPETVRQVENRVVYFPGSTIGNFTPSEARGFLARMARLVGPKGHVLIGVDLKKDQTILERAYDDDAGVTAAFNLNLLRRMNRELDATFNVDQFAHEAVYNAGAGRVEMHLRCKRDCKVAIAGDHRITFKEGERIWTESSYKYGLSEFAQLAATAGLTVDRVWTDADNLFSVQYLRVD
jgi:dimethylhistidine N-methyltransferase